MLKKVFFIYSLVLVTCISEINPISSSPILIRFIEYNNKELMQMRKEVTQNLLLFRRNKKLTIKWRKYIIKKNETFFKVMAKTMLDHDTVASVNRLVSYWDVSVGDIWLLPSMRGWAEIGTRKKISKKYKIHPNRIIAVPGNTNLFFISGKRKKSAKYYFSLKAFRRPVSGYISSGYGVRIDPFSKKRSFHLGIDIACAIGSKVKASQKGKVIFVGWKGGYGKAVILQHENGYQSLYGHLSKITVKRGDSLLLGQKIGLSGKTGRATGPHLHFEVRRRGRKVRPRFNHSY